MKILINYFSQKEFISIYKKIIYTPIIFIVVFFISQASRPNLASANVIYQRDKTESVLDIYRGNTMDSTNLWHAYFPAGILSVNPPSNKFADVETPGILLNGDVKYVKVSNAGGSCSDIGYPTSGPIVYYRNLSNTLITYNMPRFIATDGGLTCTTMLTPLILSGSKIVNLYFLGNLPNTNFLHGSVNQGGQTIDGWIQSKYIKDGGIAFKLCDIGGCDNVWNNEIVLEKKITTFNFAGLTPNVTGVIDEMNHTVTLNVPFGTNIKTIIPTINISSDTSISPTSNTPQDFSNPVTYTVTATDASTQAYTITVIIDPPIHDPIILIPGIMGTELIRDYGDKDEIWPSIRKVIFSMFDNYLKELSLSQNSEENPDFSIIIGDIIRDIPTTDIFNGLISELENNGEYTENQDLFVFPYDWRFSSVKNATLLKEKIDEVLLYTGKEKVDIVAHSMGGLLSKEYIKQNGKEKVDHLIFLGTPHLGAPKAFKALVYGDNMGFQKFYIPFLKSNIVKIISQNMPSIYELLPSRKYVSSLRYISEKASSSEWKYLDYDSTENLLIEKETNGDLLKSADTFHQNLDDLDLSGIKVSNISACGEPTISAIHIKKEAKVGAITIPEDYSLDYANGDETVPLDSSFGISNVDKYFVDKISHSSLPSALDVPDAVLSILESKDRKIDSSVFTDINNCTPVNGAIVSIHSPITLDIYDEEGNHSGLDEDGDIENNIEGVSYDTIGEAKFAFIPEGLKVEVKGSATDSGTFDLAIEKVEDGQTIETKFWNDIVITSTSQMDFNLDSYYDVESIEVDTSGNKTNLSNSDTLEQDGDYLDVPAPVKEEESSGNRVSYGSYVLKPIVIIPEVEIKEEIPVVIVEKEKPVIRPTIKSASFVKNRKQVVNKKVIVNKEVIVKNKIIVDNKNLGASVINAGQDIDLWGTIKLLFKKLFNFKK